LTTEGNRMDARWGLSPLYKPDEHLDRSRWVLADGVDRQVEVAEGVSVTIAVGL